jgi:hypothetical protein
MKIRLKQLCAAQHKKSQIELSFSIDFFIISGMKPIKYVSYRGQKMIAGWPEKIEEAQTILSVEIDGKTYSRPSYGEETFEWNTETPCHDCSVHEGELHVPSCSKEQCPKCGDQIFGCECKAKIRHLH